MPTQDEINRALEAITGRSAEVVTVPSNQLPQVPVPSMPEVKQEIKKDIIKNDNLVLTMRMQRTREGIKFYVKSQFIEDFIKAATKNKYNDEPSGWNLPRYKEVGLSQFQLPGTTLNAWGGGMYISGSIVNLSFLRVVGLSEGKDFLLQEMATKEKLEKFTQDFKNCVKSFYREFMKPFDIQVDITVEEVKSDKTVTVPAPHELDLTFNDSDRKIYYNGKIVNELIVNYIHSSRIIDAIKFARVQYDLGLKEAKELCEKIKNMIDSMNVATY